MIVKTETGGMEFLIDPVRESLSRVGYKQADETDYLFSADVLEALKDE